MSRRADAPLPLDRQLTWRLHRVNKLSDKGSGEAYAHAFGLPIGEARCLAAIGQFEPLSVVDLAARANLDKAQASRAAQALVARGLVTKQASAQDARAVVLATTRSGRRLWAEVMAVIARRNEEIFGCLSATERAQLAAMLDRVIAHAMPAR